VSWAFDRDFIKIPRGLIALLRDDPKALMTFVALLERAAWKGSTVMTKHGPLALRRGQAICGRLELAQLCGLGETATRRALKVLQTIQAISLETSYHGTIVTIIGYDVSEDRDPAFTQAAPVPPNTDRGDSATPDEQSPTPIVSNNLDPRSKKEDPDAGSRARDRSTPAPVRSAELNAERTRLHGLAVNRLNEARLDVGGRLKLSLRPIHPFDKKLEDAILFLLADEIIDRFEADLEHVLQIRIAEAIADPKKARWLSSSLFEWGAWRTALAMTLADVVPRDSGPQELAYAPVRPEDDFPDFTYGIGDRE
jgi:hypothetical protein